MENKQDSLPHVYDLGLGVKDSGRHMPRAFLVPVCSGCKPQQEIVQMVAPKGPSIQ